MTTKLLPQTDPAAVHLAYAGADVTTCLLRDRENTTEILDVTCESCQDAWARIMQDAADADAALLAEPGEE
jgi:hypothetical protein